MSVCAVPGSCKWVMPSHLCHTRYDPANQVTNILHQLTATSSQVSKANYVYNPVGNRTSLTTPGDPRPSGMTENVGWFLQVGTTCGQRMTTWFGGQINIESGPIQPG